MRQILTAAVTALIVGSLAGATTATLAQPGPAQEREVAQAGPNADRVDGRHAVGFTNQRGRRANKLVATNRGGWLPSNIVQPLWHLIKNKPPVLADGQVSFGEIAGMPPGFADGVDNAGVSQIKVTYHWHPQPKTIGPGAFDGQTAECPTGAVPIAGQFDGNTSSILPVKHHRDGNGWRTTMSNKSDTFAQAFTSGVVCLSIEPAGRLTTASKGR